MHLDVRVLASPLDYPRVGIVVPLHKHSAVDRNRLKRRLRELVRAELLPSLRERPGLDVAIRTRREAYAATPSSLRTDVLSIHARVTDSETNT
jgi:ribonuclease P protein component